VQENALWSTLEIHCLPIGNNYSTYHIKFEGDSVVENVNYRKIWRCHDENQLEWFFYGLIREDDQNRVYYKPLVYPEGLIYSFGVSVNDTVQALNTSLNTMDTLNFVVTEIDSVLMLDKFRKRISLYEYINNKEEIWIEGIGSLYGVLNSCNNAYGGVCGGYEALCYQENGFMIYQHPSYNTCHYSALVNIHDVRVNSIHIYPNPATNYIRIDIMEVALLEENLILELSSLDGKKIVVKELDKNKNILYLPKVSQGVYLLKVMGLRFDNLVYKILVD
jgi:hypothetical protein